MSKRAPSPVETVPIDRLFCSPSNPRINDAAVPHVAASLRRFGWQQPIVAKRDGEVIAGNTRLKAAQSLGMTELPVWWFEGDDLAATAFSIADNRTHEFASWNDAELARLLEQLRTEDALDGTGYSEDDIDALVQELREQEEIDKDLANDGAGEPPVVAVAKPGDLWILGEHRLLCGDSTNLKDVLRVMDGDKAALVATDPPYLVDYTGERPNDSGKDWTATYREIDIEDACSSTCSRCSARRRRSTAGTHTSAAATSSASGATLASSTTSRSSGSSRHPCSGASTGTSSTSPA